MSARFTREQRTTAASGILRLELTLAVLQPWLLMATMGAFLGRDGAVVWPTARVGLACLGPNPGLPRYVHGIER